MFDRVVVYGFPGRYGGAGTELHHQILVWQMIGLEVHIIPSNPGFPAEPLYPEMLERGVVIHDPDEWSAIESGDPVIGFCNDEFLTNLDHIHARSTNTVFVNCMSWLFEKEKERMAEGKIRAFLYQNDEVRRTNMPILQSLNDDDNVVFFTVCPYFDAAEFTFVADRDSEYFGCGRISRQDADKYAVDTLHIYEYFVSPRLKRGLFLGFDHRSEEKIGTPYHWIRTAVDHTEVSQQEFYRHCEIVLQPMDTTENWPRVGLEAMASGSVLIVDNRGGWRRMINHGETGWLCDDPRDFIYYASKMAYEKELRAEMAERARAHCTELTGLDRSIESWREFFELLEHRVR